MVIAGVDGYGSGVSFNLRALSTGGTPRLNIYG